MPLSLSVALSLAFSLITSLIHRLGNVNSFLSNTRSCVGLGMRVGLILGRITRTALCPPVCVSVFIAVLATVPLVGTVLIVVHTHAVIHLVSHDIVEVLWYVYPSHCLIVVVVSALG